MCDKKQQFIHKMSSIFTKSDKYWEIFKKFNANIKESLRDGETDKK